MIKDVLNKIQELCDTGVESDSEELTNRMLVRIYAMCEAVHILSKIEDSATPTLCSSCIYHPERCGKNTKVDWKLKWGCEFCNKTGVDKS